MKKQPHPMPWAKFEKKYLEHLADPDRPNCYIAYCRAEADVASINLPRRHQTYGAFRKAMSVARSKRNQKPEHIHT